MFKKIKIYMSENKKKILWIGSLAIIIFIVTGLATFNELKKQNNQLSAVSAKNLNKSSDHVGSDSCDIEALGPQCKSSVDSVLVDEQARFYVVFGTPSAHDEKESCKPQNFRYTWKGFNISSSDNNPQTEDGINLSVVVSTYGGTAKELDCPNVKVIQKDNSEGDQTHSCRILFMRGPDFYRAARNRIMDQSFSYTDGNISGVGNKYRSVMVRGLTPGNLAFNSDYAAENINFIENNIVNLSSKKAGLVAAFSISSIGAYNWMHAFNQAGSYVPDFLLYDPPYAVLATPWSVCRPMMTGVLRKANQFPGNGCNITYSKINGIQSFAKIWTNGTTNPDSEHSKFMYDPSVLDDIPAWVEKNCPHIYFHKVI